MANLILPASLDLCAAAPLRTEVLVLRGQDLKVDASGVRHLGGQCLQVLLAAQASWQADGFDFQIAEPSIEFANSVAVFGARLQIASLET